MEENRIVIIDGNSLLNRAYYAIQRPMITKEGLYTHAVYGFLNMLTKIRNDYGPSYMMVAFDKKAPTFRHLEYDQYKAGRKKMPPELAMQMPLMKEVLAAMNIQIEEIDGFEADDIIGTAAKEAEKAGLSPLIITGDKDELQLASDTTQVLITKKGISEFELYDRAAMIEKYGFTPQQFIDYKGLMGDQSDNIPGLPGVGEKTAQKLMDQFGSIENMLAHTDEIANEKLRTKVEENAQLAVMSKRLATICTDVPLEFDFEACKLREPNYSQLIGIYKKLEFNSLLKKMKLPEQGISTAPENSVSEGRTPGAAELRSGEDGGAGTGGATEPVVKRDHSEIELVRIADPAQLERLRDELAKDYGSAVLKVFSDDGHRQKPSVFGISILTGDTCYYIQTEITGLLEGFIDLLGKTPARFYGHHIQSDFYALMANGAEEESLTASFDTAIAQYLLEPSRSNYDLSTMILESFQEDFPAEKAFLAENAQIDLLGDPGEKYSKYGKEYCCYVQDLKLLLENRLEENGLVKVFSEVELPLIKVLASMEVQGFAVNRQELLDAGKSLSARIDELTEEIYEYAGEQFNINSPKQLGVILFEKLQLPGAKKTKTGYATGAEILERLADDHPIVSMILEFRMLSKLNGTYVEGLLPLIDAQGKIHAHFQQTVAATGRISCTEPNLQNIPIRQELGRKLRKAFVPESGDFILVGADYSQIELRVLAHMSKDPTLLEAFNNGDDIHRATAARVFGIPQDEVTALQRSNAKAVNFGVIYGMSGFGLSSNLNITRKEAEKYIDEYFKKHELVKVYMDGMVAKAKAEGFVTTIMDRKRIIPEINARNYMMRQAGERLAMNSPIQGSAADIIKLAMIHVYEELQKRKLRSRLILQVHDELIIQTHREELEEVKQLLVENMENAVELDVVLSVDLNVGENWYDLK